MSTPIIQSKIETWKKSLLDFGKRNHLYSFKETKRTTLKITEPGLDALYEAIAVKERVLLFPYIEYLDFETDDEEEQEEYERDILKGGDILTNKTYKEQQKTLAQLRSKARISNEEQGINILYLSFGLLKWTESEYSRQEILSPILLVPVKLTIESISSPYKIQLHEDEIVVNPTLAHKLSNDFGINLPELDEQTTPSGYFAALNKCIKSQKDWSIVSETYLSLLSFLKINMYKDLENHKNKIAANEVITAIAGGGCSIEIPTDCYNCDHDTDSHPKEIYQVLDADSSQQDAIQLAKKGISFVLQGPPGTGKSQTITNIIAESLATGKKVLFVSEKNAALQVVYNRLRDLRLDEFCLAIHSHKANKKEILNELDSTLRLSGNATIRDEALLRLDQLQYIRQKLNAYQAQLHTLIEPLNKTIFQINGELAKLTVMADLIFRINEPEKVTFNTLNRWKILLDRYAKTIGQLKGNYLENPWYNCNIPAVTHQLRHDTDSHLNELIPLMQELSKYISQCLQALDLTFAPCWNSISSIVEVLIIAADSPLFPAEWVVSYDIDQLSDDTIKHKETFTEIKKLIAHIETRYQNEQLDIIDAKELYHSLVAATSKLQAEVQQQFYGENISAHITKIHREAEKIHNTIQAIERLQQASQQLLSSIVPPIQSGDFPVYINILTSLAKNPKPAQAWFTTSAASRREIAELISTVRKYYSEESLLKEEIEKDFDAGITDIDARKMLGRFRTDYKSPLRFLKPAYLKDIKTLKSLCKTNIKLNYASAMSTIEKVANLREKTEWINTHNTGIKEKLGNDFAGPHTDWIQLADSFEAFCTIYDSPIVTMTEDLRNMMQKEKLPVEKINNLLSVIRDSHLDTVLTDAQLLSSRLNNTSDVQSISIKINSIIDHCKTISTTLDKINVLSSEKDLTYDTVKSDLESIIKIKDHKAAVQKTEEHLSKQYAQYWNGYNTNWDETLKAIEYAVELKKISDRYQLPETFIKKISSKPDAIINAKAYLEKIQEYYRAATTHYNWLCTIFEEKENIPTHTLEENLSRMEKCRDNKELLDEWIDYRNIKDECSQKGMSHYIDVLEQTPVSASYIQGAFLKRFYRLWLDAVLPQYSEVMHFRTNRHEDLISQFKQLDKEQQNIAKQRIRQDLISKLPNVNKANTAHDEKAILKRELSKQRRIMPLRKLFRTIPNLMTTLKPCFMMSPLSVSVFLEAESYQFDLVIFDEASQVCTENAIGAIMRGKQTIIVGDSKQLPPTSFFNASLAEADFDNDDEDTDDDSGAYESILDEALTALPERSLLWHYRSRHEHLIAFSNAKIYKNRLITFPSSVEEGIGVGVEYIYVQDGVYERGGKKTNTKEAQRVCDLVFEHFTHQPHRSLGIVTFNEAQQHAIDTELRSRRLKNREYESFFDEEKSEPFFIKNLENVQGDERDTIIFSIGYAKDTHGEMHMNFGPLSKKGGERRLNVAITRAKYNVKLVGSIRPVDLDLGRTTAEGVKMLRSYIDFASRGPVAIEGEITINAGAETESPFEESVHDFLTENGYQVVNQVGCSGYRIDMAVKHPEYNSAYVIGIECDGATYHNSRTARERDRLRQAVLEDMGWTIYRIWSTDWIKEPKSEGQRLLQAVQSAIDKFTTDPDTLKINDYQQPETDYIDIKDVETEDNFTTGYGFTEYISVDAKRYFHENYTNDSTQSFAQTIEHIVSVEQPIHKKLLYKKMSWMFGNEKVTNKVVDSMEWWLTYHCKNINSKNEILTLKDWDGTINVRIPALGDKQREIDIFPEIELEEAIRIIVSKSIGITRSGLITETARSLGYMRTGPNITSGISNAIDRMIKKSVIRSVEGRLVYPKI